MALRCAMPAMYSTPISKSHPSFIDLYEHMAIKLEDPGTSDCEADMCVDNGNAGPKINSADVMTTDAVELTSWTKKHPQHWTRDEVLDWVYFVVEQMDLDGSMVCGEAYQAITGAALCEMSREEFHKTDPFYGCKLYDVFKNLIRDAAISEPPSIDRTCSMTLESINQTHSRTRRESRHKHRSKRSHGAANIDNVDSLEASDVNERVNNNNSSSSGIRNTIINNDSNNNGTQISESSDVTSNSAFLDDDIDSIKSSKLQNISPELIVYDDNNDVTVDLGGLGMYSISTDFEFPSKRTTTSPASASPSSATPSSASSSSANSYLSQCLLGSPSPSSSSSLSSFTSAFLNSANTGDILSSFNSYAQSCHDSHLDGLSHLEQQHHHQQHQQQQEQQQLHEHQKMHELQQAQQQHHSEFSLPHAQNHHHHHHHHNRQQHHQHKHTHNHQHHHHHHHHQQRHQQQQQHQHHHQETMLPMLPPSMSSLPSISQTFLSENTPNRRRSPPESSSITRSNAPQQSTSVLAAALSSCISRTNLSRSSSFTDSSAFIKEESSIPAFAEFESTSVTSCESRAQLSSSIPSPSTLSSLSSTLPSAIQSSSSSMLPPPAASSVSSFIAPMESTPSFSTSSVDFLSSDLMEIDSDYLSDDDLFAPCSDDVSVVSTSPPPPANQNKPRACDKKKGTRRNKNTQGNKGKHLWEFVRDLLQDPECNPRLVKWEDKESGVFRFVQSEAVAKLWGKKKNNPMMTYEKLSRAMRFCRTSGYFDNVPKTGKFPKKLCFMFGAKAHGWKD